MRLLIASLVMALVAATAVQAKVVTDAKVRYDTRAGHSQWYALEVTFLTGGELNKAVGGFSYNSYGNYAVVFFGQGQAAVIAISSFMACGQSVTTSCLPTFGNIRGADQDGTQWEICTSAFC